MNKQIAFFDFDGTITQKDTLLEFIKFSKGRLPFFFGMALHIPYLLAYKLKIIANQTAKEKVLQYFFSDTPVTTFKSYCYSFSEEVLPGLIRTKALAEIKELQNRGFDVVVVSASPENWLSCWAQENNTQLIATKLEIKEGKLTGRICGQNCHGNEKVKRIARQYNLTDYEMIYAYGDTKGDHPMLELAHKKFYKPFR